jgi:tetratricopeptide (TPR) repeat protein
MNHDLPRRPDNEADARRAIELHPQSAIAYYHLGLLLAHDPVRVGETEAAYRKAIELEPDSARYIYRLGLFLHENLRHFPEAESAYRQAIALAPDDPFFYGGLVSLFIQQARHSDALSLSAKMRTLLNARENWYGLATLDAMLGNVTAALEYLRKAAAGENFNRAWAHNDPDLASLRDDPRFAEIVGNV